MENINHNSINIHIVEGKCFKCKYYSQNYKFGCIYEYCSKSNIEYSNTGITFIHLGELCANYEEKISSSEKPNMCGENE